MRGKFLAIVCLLGLHFWIHDVAGAQIDQRLPGGRCRCRKVTADPIKKSSILKIEILPSRVYCPKTEVVITTKKKQLVCIDPDVEWLKNMLHDLKQKKKQNEERQARKNMQE